MIDFEPTEEQQLIVDTVRQFATNEIRPKARECEEAAKLAPEILGGAHELGLTTNALPEAFGGGGDRSAVTGALIAEELAWGDLALALAILSPTMTAFPLMDAGTEAQRKQWLPRFAGQSFAPGSLAVLEPSYRNDPFRPTTAAKRDGDVFVLDGSKCLVPWIDGGDVVLVSASEGDRAGLFLVPRDAAGLTATPEQNMGIRALPTVELTLSSVRVPTSAKLGGDAGCELAAVVNRGRVGLAAMAVGVSRAAFEVARDYAKERHTFGAPIATRQAIAFKLADMAIEIDGLRMLVWEAAWRLDQGLDATREAALARHQAQRVALETTDSAVQILGGHGYIRDYLPELHHRNGRGFATFEALTLV